MKCDVAVPTEKRHRFPLDGLITSVIWPNHQPSLIHTLTNQVPYIN